MICKHCKTVNSDNARFCRCCGAKLTAKRNPAFLICVLSLLVIGLIVFMVFENRRSELHNDDRTDSMIVNQVSERFPNDSVTDEQESTDELYVETKILSKHFGDSFIEIEFPTSGNPILLRNIYEWMNESFGGTYQGNQNDFKLMFEYYFKKQRESIGPDEFCKTKIKKVYENSVVVSFLEEAENYADGVHSFESTKGATFRKSDGKLFSIKFINDFSSLRASFVCGLKDYFKVNSDNELLEKLQNVQSIEEIPLPTENPWITEKGVTFIYAPYEIACYAEGSPSFDIPIQEVAHCVSSTAKTFFE